MLTVSIIGAGDLGGAVAQALAERDRINRILLVDDAGSVAAGKALDIQQMGPILGFRTRVEGTDDATRVIGSTACVVADRHGKTSAEWQGEEGVTMLRSLAPYLGGAPLVFAGATQADLLSSVVRDLNIPQHRAIGSSPEAFRSAVTAIVAMEARCSPREVSLAVLGTPGRFVVAWSEASIAGYALERVLSQVQLTRIAARAPKLWPLGGSTLGLAGARVAEALAESSRQSFSVLTMLRGEFGVKDRTGALPVMLSSSGIEHTKLPTLNTRERTLLDTALGR
jgi:malate dehydrogenase